MRIGMLVLAACIATSGSAYANTDAGVKFRNEPVPPLAVWFRQTRPDPEQDFHRIEEQDINVRLVPMPLPRPANLDSPPITPSPSGHILEINVPLPPPRPDVELLLLLRAQQIIP